jgi:hypothetical protein
MQLRIVFREDVAGRGVTSYNTGGKKLINVQSLCHVTTDS